MQRAHQGRVSSVDQWSLSGGEFWKGDGIREVRLARRRVEKREENARVSRVQIAERDILLPVIVARELLMSDCWIAELARKSSHDSGRFERASRD